MKGFGFILTIVFLLFSHRGFSQDTLWISKSEAIQKASENNLQIKISEKEFESSRADFRSSNALFLPSISASHSALTTTNPLMAFGSKLNQEILTSSDFNPALLNNPDRIDNYSTRIEVLQPIINIDGWLERKAASSKMEAYFLQNERSQEYLMLDVTKAYMELQLAYKNVEVVEKTLKATQANLKLTEDYFKQGLLLKTDVLAMQVRRAELTNQLYYANSNVSNASEYLAYLFNENNNGAIYRPAEALEQNAIAQSTQDVYSDNRKDIQAMNKSLEAYKKMMQSSKMKFLPSINAFGTYELYDSELFNTDADGYLVGVSLNWNLFDGYRSIGNATKHKVEFKRKELELEQYKDKTTLEFNKTNRRLKDAENNVILLRLALEQSQESYKILENRFSQGLEKTNDLLYSETQVLKKELEYLQSIFEYNFTKQYLHFLTN